ncbi:Presequence protease 1 [Nymphaea thermarum]|nr:Presequence protease 1 [Nymphaea thermarum]
MENRLRGSGHGVAASRMDAKFNVAGWISEQMGGISSLTTQINVCEKEKIARFHLKNWPKI